MSEGSVPGKSPFLEALAASHDPDRLHELKLVPRELQFWRQVYRGLFDRVLKEEQAPEPQAPAVVKNYPLSPGFEYFIRSNGLEGALQELHPLGLLFLDAFYMFQMTAFPQGVPTNVLFPFMAARYQEFSFAGFSNSDPSLTRSLSKEHFYQMVTRTSRVLADPTHSLKMTALPDVSRGVWQLQLNGQALFEAACFSGTPDAEFAPFPFGFDALSDQQEDLFNAYLLELQTQWQSVTDFFASYTKTLDPQFRAFLEEHDLFGELLARLTVGQFQDLQKFFLDPSSQPPSMDPLKRNLQGCRLYLKVPEGSRCWRLFFEGTPLQLRKRRPRN